MKYEEYWKDICTIHLFTKHYLLLAEEMSDGLDLFLQPLKEHRDAYDHITRVYSVKYSTNIVENSEAYMESNMQKALGHEYRAFFDTADWLTYICRKKIRLLLEGKSGNDIIIRYPKYKELKLLLIELPDKIATLRGDKDIGQNNKLIDEVSEYSSIMDTLLSNYKDLVKAIDE